ncbi:EAL domain-containing protein [uncultured Methylovirgula sp.]|uniref:putative bifunctional diguanylate cyclase/phosphodiesterase n=1 Tax=uncultured Methylovirgula sp. TaxID=1285960 RepID=UPI002605CDEF|nr:EAL domain-containing protein [uncultured Methylovirgula sp.]
MVTKSLALGRKIDEGQTEALVAHRAGRLSKCKTAPAVAPSDAQSLQQLQKDVLEAVATGCALPDVVDLVCIRAEAMSPGVICSVLRADLEANCLYPLAGPSLPAAIREATSCVPIAPGVGSCGTAAFRGEAVEVTNIATDPLWAAFKDRFWPHGVRACWSTPIKGRSEQVLGTFAFYYGEPRGPDALDRRIVEACVHLCAIAIDHDNAQSRILRLAYRDQQTNLPNRTAFQQYASALIEQIGATGQTLAVHYIDLDDFKGVNDTLGHVVGDQLLSAVAQRLRTVCQGNEYIARLGGDEFAVLQFPVATPDEIDHLARKLLSCFEPLFDIDERTISIAASIGIAWAQTDSNNFTDLLRRADVALYRAKSTGRATYCLFNEDMGKRLAARREIEKDLRAAIRKGLIAPHFQPIVDLMTGKTVGFEALARWIAPARGFVPPSLFVPIAEEIGVIGPLGNLILRQACQAAASWPSDIKVAVNLSSLQLSRQDFVEDIERALAESGLAPERLELEITETVPLIENAAMREMLCDLKSRGIGIALDDFGTGYSSLSYLRSFPFDRLKIDLSFVREIQEHEQTMAIIRAVLDLARSLNVRTTAEGIESERQRVWLQAQGCTEGQGYLFDRPMPASKVVEYLINEDALFGAGTHALRSA